MVPWIAEAGGVGCYSALRNLPMRVMVDFDAMVQHTAIAEASLVFPVSRLFFRLI